MRTRGLDVRMVSLARPPSSRPAIKRPSDARVRHNGLMHKMLRTLVVVVAVTAAALASVACPDKGPVQKAGEKIDDAVDKTKDAVK